MTPETGKDHMDAVAAALVRSILEPTYIGFWPIPSSLMSYQTTFQGFMDSTIIFHVFKSYLVTFSPYINQCVCFN